MEFDCFLCGKELLCMDSTAHEMKGLTRDQVLSGYYWDIFGILSVNYWSFKLSNTKLFLSIIDAF